MSKLLKLKYWLQVYSLALTIVCAVIFQDKESILNTSIKLLQSGIDIDQFLIWLTTEYEEDLTPVEMNFEYIAGEYIFQKVKGELREYYGEIISDKYITMEEVKQLIIANVEVQDRSTLLNYFLKH